MVNQMPYCSSYFQQNGSKRENPKLRVFYSHCVQFCLNWQTYPAQLWWDDMSCFSWQCAKNFMMEIYGSSLLLIDIPSLHPTELRTLKKIRNAVVLVFQINLMMMDQSFYINLVFQMLVLIMWLQFFIDPETENSQRIQFGSEVDMGEKDDLGIAGNYSRVSSCLWIFYLAHAYVKFEKINSQLSHQ